TYTVEDNDGGVSNQANINVTVTDENIPPTAVEDSAVTNPNTAVTFNITDNDTDSDGTIEPSTVDLDPETEGQQTTQIVAGEGSYTVDESGNVTFTPEAGFAGTATAITYTVEDNDGGVSNQANINVTVTDENIPPTAVEDSAVTNPNTAVTFNITDNDTDSDGTIEPSTVDLDPETEGQQTTQIVAGEGSYTVDESGNVTFTPEAGFAGTATAITYTVEDNDGGVSNQANINVRVNTPPTAVEDSAVTNPNTAVTFNITDNDTDIDGTIEPSTVDLDPVTEGQQTTQTVAGEGSYTVDAQGNVTFTPEAGFAGTATAITYTVEDNDGGVSNQANINVIVTDENIPPTAVEDSAVTNPNTAVTFNITDNDTDSDGTIEPSTVDLDPVTEGQQTTQTVAGEGSYTVDAQGNITFNPEEDFIGTTTISYTVEDNDGGVSNQANINVRVNT
ncbi:MAG: tandem-95 repeat protein, partial [Okeania sp. SIO2D1]|nr:tandem-95 repeat protein [Okeania sp. SIO2D1]